MPEHGEFDAASSRWFCGFWMDSDEWNEIHDYSPSKAKSDEDSDSETIDNLSSEPE
jgi:hypothetical protein